MENNKLSDLILSDGPLLFDDPVFSALGLAITKKIFIQS